MFPNLSYFTVKPNIKTCTLTNEGLKLDVLQFLRGPQVNLCSGVASIYFREFIEVFKNCSMKLSFNDRVFSLFNNSPNSMIVHDNYY